MLRANIALHTPESLYYFLQKNVGPLHMIVKSGQAIISFDNPENFKIAINKFSNFLLHGFQIKLKEYHEGDLDILKREKDQRMIDEAIPSQIQRSNQISLSSLSKMVHDATQIKDPNDQIQILIKNHRKEMIQKICSNDQIFKNAKKKQVQVMESQEEPENKDKKIKQIHKQLIKSFGIIQANSKRDYYQCKNMIKELFKENVQIQLDPKIIIQERMELQPIHTVKMDSVMEYNDPEKNTEIKKICQLNENQFICTTMHKRGNKDPMGKIKIYSLNNQLQILNKQIKEGANSLIVYDKYVLVGTYLGNISFFNIDQLTNEHSSYQISLKMHKENIFDMFKFGSRKEGFSLATLGLDYIVKFWNVQQSQIMDDTYTLMFEQQFNIFQEGQIMTIENYESCQKIALGCKDRLLFYDLEKYDRTKRTQFKMNGLITKCKKLNDNLLAVSYSNRIDFFDFRTNLSIMNNFKMSNNVKSIYPLNENTICYGLNDGQIGLVSNKMNGSPIWSKKGTHKNAIYDINRTNNLILSGDRNGLIVGWQPTE